MTNAVRGECSWSAPPPNEQAQQPTHAEETVEAWRKAGAAYSRDPEGSAFANALPSGSRLNDRHFAAQNWSSQKWKPR